MELVGEERIPALFSEQRLADEQTAPSFAATWSRAQSKTFRPQRAFSLSFVAAAALLVCALALLALWSRQWQRSPEALANVPPVPTAGPAQVVLANNEVNPPAPVQKVSGVSAKSRAMKLAARRRALLVAANQKATHEAKTLASWESPTATLLDSSSGDLLKSLPQLNQTVDELKSFLPSSPK